MVTLLVRVSARQSTSTIHDTPEAAACEPPLISQHHRLHEHRDAAAEVAQRRRTAAFEDRAVRPVMAEDRLYGCLVKAALRRR
jgi:hypothetical protein